MSKKNQSLMEEAIKAVDALWSDMSVSQSKAIENMKEIISHSKSNIQATEEDMKGEKS
jgi:hypothetical protein